MTPDRELRYAIAEKGVVPKCLGEEYAYIDYDTYNIPRKDTAEALCKGCPLLELCGEAAQFKRPAWGVWGGKVYGDNKRKR